MHSSICRSVQLRGKTQGCPRPCRRAWRSRHLPPTPLAPLQRLSERERSIESRVLWTLACIAALLGPLMPSVLYGNERLPAVWVVRLDGAATECNVYAHVAVFLM